MPQNKITLLNECVAQEDSYKNRTHQKITDTLHHIIESDNKAITIGLEGEWGTGKSTVINLLEKKINNGSDDKTLFFKFDAWSHDGDPLRITFLEKLIRQIKNELIADGANEKTHEKLDELLIKATGKVKKITNTSVKTSTKFGKLLATSIMLVPIGSALFSKSYDYNNTSFIPYKIIQEINSNGITLNILEIIKSFAFLPTVSVLLLLAPLLLLLHWAFLVKGKDSISDKWEFISSTSKDKVVQDIIEQGDKTSFEFERLFTQTIDLTVGDNKPYSKVIIVIDNMDRVSHDHAKNIWSTLQVFITNDHPKSKLMWFIIPFDESVFNKIWPIEKNNDSVNDDYTSNQFTEKCFQLIIDVPTPITSNWINYLKEMSDKAFEKWNDPSLSRDFIKQYRDYFSTVNHSPTPRSLNNIINQVQALQARFMHEKQITINAITIYSLLRRTKSKREIKNIILYPQESQVNALVLKRIKTYEKELSSILFQMPYNTGLELLLDSEIKNIINSDDEHEHAKLASLQENYGDAFWQSWDSYYQKLDYKSTLENVMKSRVFLHLASNYLYDFKDNESLSSYIKLLDNHFIEDSQFIFESNDYNKAYEYINNLNKLIPILNYDKINAIKSKTSEFIVNYLDIDNVKVYDALSYIKSDIKSLSSIKRTLALLNINTLVCNDINGSKAFKSWCNKQDLEDIIIPEVLPNGSYFQEITGSIFSGNNLNELDIKYLYEMAKLNPDWDGWNNAIKDICNWAKKPVSLGQEGAYRDRNNIRATDKNSMFFRLVHLLHNRSSDGVKDKISELLSNNSFISNLYYEFSENKNNEGLALLVQPLILNGKFKPQPEIMNELNKLYETDNATCSNEV